MGRRTGRQRQGQPAARATKPSRDASRVPGFVGWGQSGRGDIAEHHEEMLWQTPEPFHDAERPPRHSISGAQPEKN